MNSSAGNITSEASTNSTCPFEGFFPTLEFCVYMINFVFGVPTHSFVLWLIISGRGNGTELYNLNLSICEIMISVICLIVVLSCWVSGLLGFIHFLLGLLYTGRPLFQTLICVERYLAVVHPVIFLKYKPLRYRLMCSVVVWVISCGSGFFILFISTVFNLRAFRFLVLIQFLIFLSVQLFCCVAVLRVLKQSGPGERGREREEENHTKKRAFNIILINTVNLFIVHVPFAIAAFISLQTDKNIVPLWGLGLICLLLATFSQPVMYLHQFLKCSCFCRQ